MDVNTIYRDVSLLHPKLSAIAASLAKDLIHAYETGRTQFRFEIFETYRSPVRQNYLFTRKTTKARAFQSAHSFGLAVDFVPFITQAEAVAIGAPRPGWCWNEIPQEAWNFLQKRAQIFGVDTPISWDRPHVEHPLWQRWLDFQEFEKGAEAPFLSGSHAKA